MNKTKVYIAKTDCLFCEELYEKFFNTVSESRQKKTERLFSRKDKNMSLGAEVLLNVALKEMGIENFQIEYRENSKPFIKGRDDVFFNLSHSESVVMCAVSEKEVGCDVEKVRDINMKTAKRFFSNEEYQQIMEKETEEERIDTFFRLWTLKESFMKATGLGFKLPLNSFSIVFSGNEIKVIQAVRDGKYYLKEYSSEDGYKYAVCSLAEEFEKAVIVEFDNLR